MKNFLADIFSFLFLVSLWMLVCTSAGEQNDEPKEETQLHCSGFDMLAGWLGLAGKKLEEIDLVSACTLASPHRQRILCQNEFIQQLIFSFHEKVIFFVGYPIHLSFSQTAPRNRL